MPELLWKYVLLACFFLIAPFSGGRLALANRSTVDSRRYNPARHLPIRWVHREDLPQIVRLQDAVRKGANPWHHVDFAQYLAGRFVVGKVAYDPMSNDILGVLAYDYNPKRFHAAHVTALSPLGYESLFASAFSTLRRPKHDHRGRLMGRTAGLVRTPVNANAARDVLRSCFGIKLAREVSPMIVTQDSSEDAIARHVRDERRWRKKRFYIHWAWTHGEEYANDRLRREIDEYSLLVRTAVAEMEKTQPEYLFSLAL